MICFQISCMQTSSEEVKKKIYPALEYLVSLSTSWSVLLYHFKEWKFNGNFNEPTNTYIHRRQEILMWGHEVIHHISGYFHLMITAEWFVSYICCQMLENLGNFNFNPWQWYSSFSSISPKHYYLHLQLVKFYHLLLGQMVQGFQRCLVHHLDPMQEKIFECCQNI